MTAPDKTIHHIESIEAKYNQRVIDELYDLLKTLIEGYENKEHTQKPGNYSDDEIFNRAMARIIASEVFQNIPKSYDEKWSDIPAILKARAETAELLKLEPTPEKVIEITRERASRTLEPKFPTFMEMSLPLGDCD